MIFTISFIGSFYLWSVILNKSRVRIMNAWENVSRKDEILSHAIERVRDQEKALSEQVKKFHELNQAKEENMPWIKEREIHG